MVTEIIITIAVLPAHQCVQADTVLFDDIRCHDVCLVYNIDKFNFGFYVIGNTFKLTTSEIDADTLLVIMFNLDMIRKSLHPV